MGRWGRDIPPGEKPPTGPARPIRPVSPPPRPRSYHTKPPEPPLFKLRPSGRRKDERCVLCHDGPDGLVICRGCGALTHAQCLLGAGSCPTPGCDERDPLAEPPPSVRGRLKDWLAYRRAEKGPKEEPACRHKFGKDQRCVYCHRDVDDIWQDGPPKQRAASADERIADFFEDVKRHTEANRRSKQRRLVLTLVVAVLLGLISAIAKWIGG